MSPVFLKWVHVPTERNSYYDVAQPGRRLTYRRASASRTSCTAFSSNLHDVRNIVGYIVLRTRCPTPGVDPNSLHHDPPPNRPGLPTPPHWCAAGAESCHASGILRQAVDANGLSMNFWQAVEVAQQIPVIPMKVGCKRAPASRRCRGCTPYRRTACFRDLRASAGLWLVRSD
jgi:hypothetical protein